MEHALHIAQGYGPHRQLFNGACGAANGDHITDVDDVFELDENTGDDVLHHFLRPETNRQTQDPGRGQQRPDIKPDLAEHKHQRKDHQRDGHRVAQQRQQSCLAGRWDAAKFGVQFIINE